MWAIRHVDGMFMNSAMAYDVRNDWDLGSASQAGFMALSCVEDPSRCEAVCTPFQTTFPVTPVGYEIANPSGTTVSGLGVRRCTIRGFVPKISCDGSTFSVSGCPAGYCAGNVDSTIDIDCATTGQQLIAAANSTRGDAATCCGVVRNYTVYLQSRDSRSLWLDSSQDGLVPHSTTEWWPDLSGNYPDGLASGPSSECPDHQPKLLFQIQASTQTWRTNCKCLGMRLTELICMLFTFTCRSARTYCSTRWTEWSQHSHIQRQPIDWRLQCTIDRRWVHAVCGCQGRLYRCLPSHHGPQYPREPCAC